MKFCSRCGCENKDEAVFCQKCGNSMNEIESDEKTVGLFTEQNSSNNNFYDSDKTVSVYNIPSDGSIKVKKTPNAKIISVICVFAVVCVGSVVFALSNTNKVIKEDNTTESVNSRISETENKDSDITSQNEVYNKLEENISSSISIDSSQEPVIEESDDDYIEPDYSGNEDSVVIVLDNGDTYKLESLIPINYFDYDKIIESVKDFDSTDFYAFRCDGENAAETSKVTDGNFRDGDELKIYNLAWSGYENSEFRTIFESCGVNLLNTTLATDEDKGEHVLMYYSSDKNEPFRFIGKQFRGIYTPCAEYSENYILDRYDSVFTTVNYSVKYCNTPNDDIPIILSTSGLKNNEHQRSEYSLDGFDGSITDIDTCIGMYTNANGIEFVLEQHEVLFEENGKDAKRFTNGYDAYTIKNGGIHQFTVSEYHVSGSSVTPDSVPIPTLDEFKELLDTFSE